MRRQGVHSPIDFNDFWLIPERQSESEILSVCSFRASRLLPQKQSREGSCHRALLVRVFCTFLCGFPGRVSPTACSAFLFYFENSLCQRAVPQAMPACQIKRKHIYLPVCIRLLRACRVFQLWKEHSHFNMARLYADSLEISKIISLNLLLFQAFILSITLCVLGFHLQPTHHLQSSLKCATAW